jgi:hypothetical protein
LLISSSSTTSIFVFAHDLISMSKVFFNYFQK